MNSSTHKTADSGPLCPEASEFVRTRAERAAYEAWWRRTDKRHSGPWDAWCARGRSDERARSKMMEALILARAEIRALSAACGKGLITDAALSMADAAIANAEATNNR